MLFLIETREVLGWGGYMSLIILLYKNGVGGLDEVRRVGGLKW